MGFYSNGVGWVRIFLAGSQSRLYPHMRAKFGRDQTAALKKVAFKFISRFYLKFERECGAIKYIFYNTYLWHKNQSQRHDGSHT